MYYEYHLNRLIVHRISQKIYLTLIRNIIVKWIFYEM